MSARNGRIATRTQQRIQLFDRERFAKYARAFVRLGPLILRQRRQHNRTREELRRVLLQIPQYFLAAQLRKDEVNDDRVIRVRVEQCQGTAAVACDNRTPGEHPHHDREQAPDRSISVDDEDFTRGGHVFACGEKLYTRRSTGLLLAAQSVAMVQPTIAESLREYGRGLAGGLIFSLPLLYTMEVWWAGFIAHPARMFVYVLAVFLLLLGYNRYAGLRHDASWSEVAIDSVEELGLGVVISAIALYAIGRIGPHATIHEALGQIFIEAGIVAIGVSIGTAQLGTGDDDDSGMGSEKVEVHFAGQLVITFCGAVLFAANVAPTEEILVIAIETSPARLLLLAAFSLALGALVLYFSDFARAARYSPKASHWHAFSGTVISYAIALVASAAILYFFGRFDGQAPEVMLAEIVVLGFPASLGASAGRLLLQS